VVADTEPQSSYSSSSSSSLENKNTKEKVDPLKERRTRYTICTKGRRYSHQEHYL
jgi:hypothetical protein